MAKKDDNATFDIEQQQIAAVYAKAFLGAAEEAGQTDSLAAEFDSLFDQVLDSNPSSKCVFYPVIAQACGGGFGPNPRSWTLVPLWSGITGDLESCQMTPFCLADLIIM